MLPGRLRGQVLSAALASEVGAERVALGEGDMGDRGSSMRRRQREVRGRASRSQPGDCSARGPAHQSRLLVSGFFSSSAGR